VEEAVLSLFDRYLAGDAAAFYPSHFQDPDDRRRAAAHAARPLAPVVADAIAAQNARLAPSPARDAHLAALRAGAGAVVTGQQVGLFLGPLFTVYKAASAIRLAQALREERARRWCRSSGCRPRTTICPRSPAVICPAPTARRARWRCPPTTPACRSRIASCRRT
jgi:hypothetical protein